MKLKHKIQISDPWDFDGPNGDGCILVNGIGKIKGPEKPNWQSEYYLVEPEEPLSINGTKVRQLICSPRYSGDTLEQVMERTCTVGIAIVKESCSLDEGASVKVEDVDYWAIGTMTQVS